MAQDPLPDGVLPLDELELLVVVDNETDGLSSVDEGVPQIPEIVHLAARTPSSRRYQGHECKTVFDQLCCACHGLSVVLTGAGQSTGAPATRPGSLATTAFAAKTARRIL